MGHVLPLISEAVTGTQASVGPPWFERYVTPLGIVLVLLTGAGPLFAWRKTTPRALVRALVVPAAAAGAVLALVIVLGDGTSHPAALVAFAVMAFTGAALGGEVVRGTRARRDASRESWPVALVGLMRRNRRRYGGYTVHAGVALLLLGVAASSSFGTVVDRQLRPGQRMRVAGYDLTYRKPRTGLTAEKLTFGTVVDVRRDGRFVTTLRPSRELYPSTDASSIVGRYFSGEQTSEIGLDSSLGKDVWVAVQPNFDALKPAISEAERRFGTSAPRTQALVIAIIQQKWARDGLPVTFRGWVRTGVSWIWLGAGVVSLGTLFAGWPTRPRHSRARVPRVAPSGAAPTAAPARGSVEAQL